MVVGHALHNDFRALKYVHPRSQTRDTTYVPNLLSQRGLHTRARVSLKELALQLLHKKIQVRVRVWGAGGKQASPPYRGGPRLGGGAAPAAPHHSQPVQAPGLHVHAALGVPVQPPSWGTPLPGSSLGSVPQLQARCLPLQPGMEPQSGQLLTPAPTARHLLIPLLFKPRAAFISFIFEGTG